MNKILKDHYKNIGSMGGKAAAKNMTPIERINRSSTAGQENAKKRDVEHFRDLQRKSVNSRLKNKQKKTGKKLPTA